VIPVTYEEIAEMMREMGLPFAYHHFAEGESPNPPFLIFLSPGEHTFGADNVMYHRQHRTIDRPMTTPLFLLRCKQLGLSMTELDLLTIGLINDMFCERERDDFDGWTQQATQEDFDR
jgi:hypothetical protein